MTHSTSSLAAQLAGLHDLTQQTYPTGALYVVATPLGNLADISLRALHVLGLVDAIACEDTRNTGALLTRFGIKSTLFAAHEHNEREAAEQVLQRLQSGQRVALVSDAGTPAVSDPGARMVDTVLAAGLRVIPLPGPSAMVAALSVSGLLSGEFHFAGFLPTRAAQRASALRKLANISATLVFYEAPHRVLETVQSLQAELGGERMLVICRELTKQFEQVQRCRLDQAQAWLEANDNHQRGEFVLLVEGAPEQEADSGEVDRVLGLLLKQCPVKQAATLAAQILGMKKNALYDRALELKKAGSDAEES